MGSLKASPGVWALQPFTLATEAKVANQAAMVALGRPGAGEALLADAGFVDIGRVEIPFAWEFADPETYARTLAATGPGLRGDPGDRRGRVRRARAVELAAARVRDGLPLRAELAVVGYLARTPRRAETRSHAGAGLLAEPAPTPETERLYDEDEADVGYVMNVSRLWAPPAGGPPRAVRRCSARARGPAV